MSADLQPEAAPAVGVVLPVRDGAATIAIAIESIRRQTYADWELYVLDDGSTDATVAIARSFGDPRIRVLVDGRKRGLAARLNQGIELARGRYLARMDADDVAYPERLARQVGFLDAHADVDLLGTRVLLYGATGEPLAPFPFRATHAEICRRPWNGFYLPHPTWMGRIEWFKRFRYRVPEVIWAEDQDMLLRAYDSSSFACLPEILLGYRVGPVKLSKLLGVRINLAGAEFSVNMRAGRPGHALLGAAVFMAKALIDAARFLAGGSAAWRYRKVSLPEAETARWRELWRELDAANSSRTPLE